MRKIQALCVCQLRSWKEPSSGCRKLSLLFLSLMSVFCSHSVLAALCQIQRSRGKGGDASSAQREADLEHSELKNCKHRECRLFADQGCARIKLAVGDSRSLRFKKRVSSEIGFDLGSSLGSCLIFGSGGEAAEGCPDVLLLQLCLLCSPVCFPAAAAAS